MDGEALMAAFATCSGPDCIKLQLMGLGLKSIMSLRLQLEIPINIMCVINNNIIL